MTAPTHDSPARALDASCAMRALSSLASERPRALAAAGTGAAAVLAWYAMPDLVRSRGLRAFFKTGLAAAVGWAQTYQFEETESFRTAAALAEEAGCRDCPKADDTGFAPGDSPESPEEDPLEGVTEADPKELAILGAVASAVVIGTVAVEKAIFRRGQRRRAAGVRCAHLRQAVPLALVTGAVELAVLAADHYRDQPCPRSIDEAGAGAPVDDPGQSGDFAQL